MLLSQMKLLKMVIPFWKIIMLKKHSYLQAEQFIGQIMKKRKHLFIAKLKQERLFIQICENNNIEYSIARIFGLISNFL